MFEEYYEKLPDKNAYLSRIGIENHDLPPTLETLDKLIMAHLTHVPFEALDVYESGLVPRLDIAGLFNKVVTRRRGGYCFELNAIFMSLLEAVGFEVHAAARIIWRRRDVFPSHSHRITVVVVGGERRYCDVGFGGPSPTRAVLIDSDELQEAENDRFIVRTGDRDPKTVRRVTDDGEEAILYFLAQPYDPVDFIPLNFYISQNDTSLFRTKRTLNIKTPEGSSAIDGDILRIRANGVLTETPLASVEDTRKAMLDYFGIIYDGELKSAPAV